MSKSFDNGMVQLLEQAVIIDKEVYDESVQSSNLIIPTFVNKKESSVGRISVLRQTARTVLVLSSTDIVGAFSYLIAEQAGFSVPEDTNILAAECKEVGEKEPLTCENFVTCHRCLSSLNPVKTVLKRPSSGIPWSWLSYPYSG